MWRRPSILAGILILVVLCVGAVQLTIRADELPFYQVGTAPLAAPSADGPAPPAVRSLSAYAPLPQGLAPFLSKPFEDTYENRVKLHAFFDHRLPIYDAEAYSNVPQDIRDSNRTVTQIFTGESRTAVGAAVNDQGRNWYSGHNGIDYGHRAGGPRMAILAAADGVIAQVSGCHMYIGHDASTPPDNRADYTTYYTHLSAIGQAPEAQRSRPGRDASCGSRWCAGDTIARGELVGTEGNDACGGVSWGDHLHFGVAVGALDSPGSRTFIDPFGWWHNDPDPWADTRLRQFATSYWLWAAPANPAPGQPGHWGDNIAAQTDDTSPSFHRFTTLRRESLWLPMPSNFGAGVQPIGGGAWRSSSLGDGSPGQETWAVWALHVPDTAAYRIQVHIPATAADIPAPTATARYQVHIPTGGGLDIWRAQDVNQDRNNEWVDLVKSDGTDTFDLQARDIVLVRLGDITGRTGETVLFDAVRLYQIEPSEPPADGDLRRVGFVIDNSTSMLQQGKISAVRSVVPPWIDQLEASSDSYTYALDAFADRVGTVLITEDAEEMKGWIGDLRANDNGLPNVDCPEASLGSVQDTAPHVAGGNILLFTDDLPKDFLNEQMKTAVVLAREHVKLHVIILPKTCSGGSSLGWLSYQSLALTTGGTYQVVPTTRTNEALQIVLAAMEDNVSLAATGSNRTTYRDGALSPAAEGAIHEVIIDPTVTRAGFLLNTLSGSLSMSLYRPNGSLVSPGDPDVTYIDSGSANYYRIANPTAGVWRVDVTGSGDYVLRTSGQSDIQFAYLGDTYVAQGEAMQLAARISGPIQNPAFALETPDGMPITTVPMFDNGTLGDYTAGDGVYTGIYVAQQSTDVRMRVTGTTTGGQPFTRHDPSLIRLTSVTVSEPKSVTLLAGNDHTFEFVVTNKGNVAAAYRLTATSGEGWIRTHPPSQINLGAGQSQTVSVRVAVPDIATPNSFDNIRLTVARADNAADLGSAVTNVFVPDFDGSKPEPQSGTLFLPLALNDPAPPSTPLLNGNFEQGRGVGWREQSSKGYPLIYDGFDPKVITPHSGRWMAWLGGVYNDTSTLSQSATVPTSTPVLSFYHLIASADSCGHDIMRVRAGGRVVFEQSLCGATQTNGWARRTVNLSSLAGQTVLIEFTVTTNGTLNSNLFLDDVSFAAAARQEGGDPPAAAPHPGAPAAVMKER